MIIRRRLNLRKLTSLPWSVIILVTIAVAVGQNSFNAYASITVYDFIAQATAASWNSGAGVLPFPGDPADDRGFACYVSNALLEDGSTWTKVLETHPQWVSNGYIMGTYPQQTVPTNIQLTVRIGFLSGATGTDGARFEAYFDEYRGMNVAPLRYTIFSQVATLDGKLDLITKDLAYLAGKKGTFILYVNAGQSSGRDWAVWAEARMEAKALPDLVITDIWEDDGQIHYKVKNVGEVATSAQSFGDALSVDGKQVAKHYITQVLQAGQELEGAFDYTWQPAPGEHAVMVCADCEQNVDESNEQNNCLEEKWVKENLPDLVIVEIKSDRNNSIIGYVLKNVGDETAKGGHSTTLYVDGKETTHDLVGVDLSPGETYESWFKEYEWPECHNITVKVCADNYDQVKESDEGNNFLEIKCISYPISILITSGPSAMNATQDSVTIVWVTNKLSDSLVKYSDRLTGEENFAYHADPVKNHEIKITSLKPRTTYRFYIESKDSCGNLARSKGRVFETLAPPDEEGPSVTLFLSENLSGVVNITANASDNVGVTHVLFLMDAHVKFIDFSPPYLWVCNTTLFPNGAHSFRAVAVDAASNAGFDARNGTINNIARDIRPPAVSILRPSDEENVIGMVEIEALIQDMALADETVGHIQKVEIYIDSVLVRSWVYSPFRFDIFRRELVTEAPTNRLALTHLWNTTGLELGSEHKIEVKGWDDSGNYGRASINVSILRFEEYQPPLELRIIDLEVTREVVRHDIYQTTYFVTLSVKNTGTETLFNFTLGDYVSGFQVIPHTASMNVTFASSFWTSIVIFKPDPRAALPPGSVATIQYFAVPILFDPPIPDECYIFGWLPTSVSFSCDGVPHARSFELSYSPGRANLSLVLRSADYVIITNPSMLFHYNPDGEDSVNSLLVKMAELARLKSGVLGYISGYRTAEQLKAAISPGGAWASQLNSAFSDPNPEMNRDAYVLIVGETEIVPSYTMDGIKLCDLFYGDVVEDGSPDLILGRIIGETAMDLMKPIQTSISVALGTGFDRSYALGVSGYEDGGYAAHAVDIAGDVVSDLTGQGVPGETLHWSTFIRYAWGFHFTDYDAFALGDVDGDGIDEVIIASDEYGRIYIYETTPRSLVRDFPCAFTRYDGLASGDLDGDGGEEIAIAVNPDEGDGGAIYVYEPDGSLIDSREVSFANWDAVAMGDVVGTGWTEGSWIGDGRDEIVLISEGRDAISVYVLDDENHLKTNGSHGIDVDFTRYDGFAVGNVRQDWGRDEIAIIRDDDECIYLYNAYGRRLARIENARQGDELRHVRYTSYDGFAIGDVDEDGEDEMLVVCDDDKTIYNYNWNGWWEGSGGARTYHPGTEWLVIGMYSRFLGDWFDGIRYTGSPTGHDCFAIGRVITGENPKVVIIRNRNGDLSSFQALVSTWGDADPWANKRLRLLGYADIASFIMIYGHGNPFGASPLGIPNDVYWGDLPEHPFVLSLSCTTGDYESWGDSFGEAFFRHGAGAFAGAAEVSYCCENENVGREYFERWDIWNVRAGKAYTIFERRWYRTVGNFWARVFNYYGDPKFPTGG